MYLRSILFLSCVITQSNQVPIAGSAVNVYQKQTSNITQDSEYRPKRSVDHLGFIPDFEFQRTNEPNLFPNFWQSEHENSLDLINSAASHQNGQTEGDWDAYHQEDQGQEYSQDIWEQRPVDQPYDWRANQEEQSQYEDEFQRQKQPQYDGESEEIIHDWTSLEPDENEHELGEEQLQQNQQEYNEPLQGYNWSPQTEYDEYFQQNEESPNQELQQSRSLHDWEQSSEYSPSGGKEDGNMEYPEDLAEDFDTPPRNYLGDDGLQSQPDETLSEELSKEFELGHSRNLAPGSDEDLDAEMVDPASSDRKPKNTHVVVRIKSKPKPRQKQQLKPYIRSSSKPALPRRGRLTQKPEKRAKEVFRPGSGPGKWTRCQPDTIFPSRMMVPVSYPSYTQPQTRHVNLKIGIGVNPNHNSLSGSSPGALSQFVSPFLPGFFQPHHPITPNHGSANVGFGLQLNIQRHGV